MREPADCVADASLNLDLAPGSPVHFFDNLRRDFQLLKGLLGNGVFNGLQILADFLLSKCAAESYKETYEMDIGLVSTISPSSGRIATEAQVPA
jgi:hypothetical protein